MHPDRLLERNREFKNAHAGKRCFIIGNGPSINQQNLLPLEKELTIVVNDFFLGEIAPKIRPDYWLIADPLYWTEAEKYLFRLTRGVLDISPATKLLMPCAAYSTLSKAPLEVSGTPYFFQYDLAGDYSRGIPAEIDFARPIPSYGQNILSVALMLAFSLGCTPIFLVGFDHSWWAWTEDDTSYSRFYQDSIAFELPMSLDEIEVTNTVQKFEYLQLLNYARRHSFDIFNATAGGYLETFPRVRYEDIITARASEPPIPSATSCSTAPVMELAQNALLLLNQGSLEPALELLEQARARNINCPQRVDGLEYLRAVCLSRMGRNDEAVIAARQDQLCNPQNRARSAALLEAMNKVGC